MYQSIKSVFIFIFFIIIFPLSLSFLISAFLPFVIGITFCCMSWGLFSVVGVFIIYFYFPRSFNLLRRLFQLKSSSVLVDDDMEEYETYTDDKEKPKEKSTRVMYTNPARKGMKVENVKPEIDYAEDQEQPKIYTGDTRVCIQCGTPNRPEDKQCRVCASKL